MNCQQCNDLIYDYVDDALGNKARASVQEHLRQCADCQRALLREKAVAQSIKHSLDRATASLSFRPEMLRNVLEARESEPVQPNLLMRVCQWFISNPLRSVSASAALVGAMALFLGLQAHYRLAQNSASQAAPLAGRIDWVIDVPIQTQTHLFLRQQGTVIDASAPGMAFARAHLRQPHNSPKSL